MTKLEKIEYLDSLLPKSEEGFYLHTRGKKLSYGGIPKLIFTDISLTVKEDHIVE